MTTLTENGSVAKTSLPTNYYKRSTSLTDADIPQDEKRDACNYVLYQLRHLLDYVDEDSKKQIIRNQIKFILEKAVTLEILVYCLEDLKVKLSLSRGDKIDTFIDHLILQASNIDTLSKMHDSDIVKTSTSKATLKTDTPSFLSTNYMRKLFNLPNPYTNPAEMDHSLLRKNLSKINFKTDLAIIYVEGADYNSYGHSILKLGKYGYIHVNSLYEKPQYIKDDQHFATYLSAQGGHVTGIQKLYLPKHKEAQEFFKYLVERPWAWLMTHHNCLSFTHKIAFAGGVAPSDLGYESNMVHPVSKLPVHYLHKVTGAGFNPHIMDWKKYTYYRNKMTEQFKYYFKDSAKQSATERQKAIDYYAFLRSNGLSKEDAIEYVSLAYHLATKKHIELSACRTSHAFYTPLTLYDNMKAFFNAAYTKCVGKKRLPIQYEVPDEKIETSINRLNRSTSR